MKNRVTVGAGHRPRPQSGGHFIPWILISGGDGAPPLRFLWIIPLLLGCLHAEGFLADQAQLAWQDRDKPGQTETAIRIWENAVKAEPARGELWIDLTKAYGRAVRHAQTAADRKRWSDRARECGEEAVRRNPQSSDAYAFYGEALGQWADAHKGVHSLKMVGRAVEALQKAVTLDPKNARAHMLLSQFYRQSPRLLSIGDKTKALEEARLAVQYGPGYAIDHLALAQACLEVGKKEEAIAELQRIVTITAPADAIPETRADQQTALSMLKDLGLPQANPACGETGGYCTEQTP